MTDALQFLQRGNNFLVIIHIDPDGDAVGSALSLVLGLKKMGKKSLLACRDPLPAIFDFLIKEQKIVHDFLLGDFDNVILIDCGDLRRTGFPERLKDSNRARQPLLNIDHHHKNDIHRLATINLFDYNVSSAAEIIYGLLCQLNIKIDPLMATGLLTGLYTDTGGFQHANISVQTLQITSQLLSRGARLPEIVENISLNKSVSTLKIWGKVLERARKNRYGLLISAVSQKDLEEAGEEELALSGLANLMAATEGTKGAILFSETDEGIKASLRTEQPDIDMAHLAEIFGGGGHKKAAGFTIPGRVMIEKKGWRVEADKLNVKV